MATFTAKVSKWGNSLAIRLPARLVHELGLDEGNHVKVNDFPEKKVQVPGVVCEHVDDAEVYQRIVNRYFKGCK